MITPSGPINMEYISELTIHSKNVHPLDVKKIYNTSFESVFIEG